MVHHVLDCLGALRIRMKDVMLEEIDKREDLDDCNNLRTALKVDDNSNIIIGFRENVKLKLVK